MWTEGWMHYKSNLRAGSRVVLTWPSYESLLLGMWQAVYSVRIPTVPVDQSGFNLGDAMRRYSFLFVTAACLSFLRRGGGEVGVAFSAWIGCEASI